MLIQYKCMWVKRRQMNCSRPTLPSQLMSANQWEVRPVFLTATLMVHTESSVKFHHDLNFSSRADAKPGHTVRYAKLQYMLHEPSE